MHYLSLILTYVVRDFQRGRTVFFLVVSSLTVAAASVMTTSSVLLGFDSMLAKGAQGWVGNIAIIPTEDNTGIAQSKDIVADVKSLQYVEAVSLRSSASGLIKYKEKTSYPSIVGVNTLDETQATSLPQTLIKGKFFDEEKDSDSIILGLNTADSLVGTSYDGNMPAIGSKVQLLTKEGTYKDYAIKGIIDAKNFFPNWAAFLQKDELEKVVLSENNNFIVVKLSDPNKLQEMKTIIQSRHPDVVVHTWQEEAGYVEDILQGVRYITALITTLLIFSVFIIISIVIFINTNQERRQIGIMRSMGAKSRFVIIIYVLEALFYLIIAYFAGLLLFFAIHTYSVHHPVPMPIGDFHTVASGKNFFHYFLILLFSSLVGGFIPSYFITRQRIIETLRSV